MSESEKIAWQEGFDAFDKGKSDTANPYPIGSNEHLSWNDGYLEAEEQHDS